MPGLGVVCIKEFQKIKLCDDNLTEKKQLSGGAIAKKNGDTFEKITNIPTKFSKLRICP